MLTLFVHSINSVIVSDLTISLLLATHHLSFLSYDVAVIQWITSCYKNRMTTRVITLWRVHVTSLTTYMSAMHFLIEIMLILKAIKSYFKGSYDKKNLKLMVISYEIYEIRRRRVSLISYKMTTRVRSSIQ